MSEDLAKYDIGFPDTSPDTLPDTSPVTPREVTLGELVNARRQAMERLDALTSAIAFRHEAERDAFVDTIRGQIQANGYEVPVVAAKLYPEGFRATVPLKARKPRSKAGSESKPKVPRPIASSVYPVYVLPNDETRTYTRGPLPVWMKDMMTACHLDPTVAKDRAIFKEEHLVVRQDMPPAATAPAATAPAAPVPAAPATPAPVPAPAIAA